MPGTRADKPPLTWFRKTFGFEEAQPNFRGHRDERWQDKRRSLHAETRESFSFENGELLCKPSGRRFWVGAFETPTVSELHTRCSEATMEANDGFWAAGSLQFEHCVADVSALHRDRANAGAVFQVMSLFNCLETTPPGTVPEDGITHYAREGVQGAACAVACAAASVYRHYVVSGQGTQIDCLSEVAAYLDNKKKRYWNLQNGYCLPCSKGTLAQLNHRLEANPVIEDAVRSRLRVGVHWDTEVTGTGHRVCQILCSALPVGMVKSTPAHQWETLATALLEAAYDATLAAAAMLAAKRGCRVRVFLTVLGGGALGNRQHWVAKAVKKALVAHGAEPLDVFLVHFAEIPTSGPLSTLHDGLEALSLRMSPSSPDTFSPTVRVCTPQAQMLRDELVRLKLDSANGLADRDSVTLEGRSKYLSRFDTDGNGMLDSTELTSALEWYESCAADVGSVFCRFDRNGDGIVDSKEFFNALHQVDSAFFTKSVVTTLLRDADADGDDVVHYAEFFAWLFGEDPVVVNYAMAMKS